MVQRGEVPCSAGKQEEGDSNPLMFDINSFDFCFVLATPQGMQDLSSSARD